MLASHSSTFSPSNRRAKHCSRCARPASLSLAQIVSTIGVSPRRQKCGEAVLLCTACIQSLELLLAASPFSTLSKALIEAYTSIAGQSATPAKSHTAIPVHQEVTR